MATDSRHELRKRPRQQRSRETVERILDAAAHIFEREGYVRTTTNDVAAQAGVSIGSLYQYFPSKDALLVALAERHLDDVAARFAEQAALLRASEPPLAHVVAQLIGLSVELHETDRLHQLLAHQAPRTAHLNTQLDHVLALIAAEVEHHLVRCGADGDDGRLRALLLVHMVDAAVHDVVLAAARGSARQRATTELTDLVVSALDA